MDTFGAVFNNRYLFDNDSYRGEWLTGSTYQPGDIIAVGQDLYRATINHTSSTFAADLASGKIKYHVGISRTEIQNQTATSATTTGTAPTYVAAITPTPTLAAGLRLRIKFHAATSAASTLNLNTRGAKPLKQYDSTGSLVNASVFVNQLTDIEYDGTNWVILDPVIGAPTVANFANSKTVNGWQKLEGGLIIQWGTAGFAASNALAVQTTVTFPIAFPTACVHISGVQTSRASNSGGGTWAMRPTNRTLANFVATLECNTSYNFTLAQTAEWIAIGY